MKSKLCFTAAFAASVGWSCCASALTINDSFIGVDAATQALIEAQTALYASAYSNSATIDIAFETMAGGGLSNTVALNYTYAAYNKGSCGRFVCQSEQHDLGNRGGQSAIRQWGEWTDAYAIGGAVAQILGLPIGGTGKFFDSNGNSLGTPTGTIDGVVTVGLGSLSVTN
jgi:hypothetical protein